MSRLLIGLVAVVALAVSVSLTASATAATAPGGVAARVADAEFSGRLGVAWSLLHPAQRRFVTRRLYVRCLSRVETVPPRRVRVLGVRPERITIPGTRVRADARAVRLLLEFGGLAPSKTWTVTVARVAGGWAWVSEATSAADFKRRHFCS